MRKQKQFELYLGWLDTPDLERNPRTKLGFAHVHKLSEPTLYNWDKLIARQRGESGEGAFNDYMTKLEALIFSPKGTSNDRTLYARIKGWLVEKSEVKHEFALSAEEHFRIDQEADRRIQEFKRAANGNQGMSEEPPLLLNEVCLDAEQEHGANG